MCESPWEAVCQTPLCAIDTTCSVTPATGHFKLARCRIETLGSTTPLPPNQTLFSCRSASERHCSSLDSALEPRLEGLLSCTHYSLEEADDDGTTAPSLARPLAISLEASSDTGLVASALIAIVHSVGDLGDLWNGEWQQFAVDC